MGIVAYTLIVLPQRHFSAFAGGIVLSFIMVPTLVRTTEEMVRLVPKSLREGSLALGAAEWKTSFSVVLPAALNGLLTGVLLAIARAAGEAAPMLFTAFGNPFLNTDFAQPVSDLTSYDFRIFHCAIRGLACQGLGTALVLISLVLLLNVLARLFVWWRARKLGVVKP